MKTYKPLIIIALSVVFALSANTAQAIENQDPTDNPVIEKNAENGNSSTSVIMPKNDDVNKKPVNSVDPDGFPFIGVVKGDNVYVRSGPATPYYPVGKLSKNQEVIVTQIRPGKTNWARIEPVAGCFAYISSQYVEVLDTVSIEADESDVDTDPGMEDEAVEAAEEDSGAEKDASKVNLLGKELLTGVVTADNVRIRAGSIDIAPQNANRVLMLAKKGQQVKVIGKRDDFYKIVPPRGSYFWVSAEFITRSNKSTAANLNLLRNKTRDEIATVKTTDELKTQYVQLNDVLKKYEAVQKMPLMDRDYASLRSDIEKMAKETDSATVKSTAEMLLKTILKGETAQKQLVAAIAQDKKIEEAMLKIDQAVDKALKENMPANDAPDIIVVKGKLTESAVFTTGVTKRYLLLNESGMISCYVSGKGLDKYVGKNVSISGPTSFDPSTQTRFIEASKVVLID